MLKRSKTVWKICEVFSQLTTNKLRFSLTVVGIAVGTLLYFLFSVLTYSYIQSSYNEYKSFAENTLLVQGELSGEAYSHADAFFGDLPSTAYYTSESLDQMQFSVRGVTVFATVSLTCTNTPCTSIAVRGSGSNIVNRAHIIAGRDFEASDFQNNKKMAVIPSLAAKLLFPNEDAVGKRIAFSMYDTEYYSPSEFTIIGVYSDTPAEEACVRRINTTKPGGNVQIALNLYAPVSVLTDSERANFSRSSTVYYSKDIDKLYNRAKAYFDGYEYVSLYTKNSHFRMINELNRSVNSFLSIVMVIIIIISGISILNSMIFSVRERIPEIGIRKSFGADSFDIVARFVLEGAITAMFGVLFAVLIAVAILIGVKFHMDSQPSPLLRIHFSWYILVKTICFALLEGIMGSIIPAIYAAKIQIADAVRFD